MTSLRLLGLLLGSATLVPVACALPPATIAACLGMSAVVAAMAWAWAWLSEARRPAELALSAGLGGGAVGVGLAGFAMLFGAASVIVLPALYVVAAMLFWLLRTPTRPRRPC